MLTVQRPILTYFSCYQLIKRTWCVNWSLVPGVSWYDVEFKQGIIEIPLKLLLITEDQDL